MEHVCDTCGHATTSERAPRFCSECGSRFALTAVEDAPTIQPETDHVTDMATIGPTGPPTAPPAVGQKDAPPGFKVVRELGRGGMGVVFEAVEESTGRNVALKVLSSGANQDAEAVERFLREGKIAASLSHPRSTFVYDAGEADGRFFITMELMPGGTVKDIVDREGKLSVEAAVNHTLDMLEGLEAAHDIDVVHRDVKPSNCFLTADGRVKVGDFGISKSLVADASLTRTGAFMGTPMFAAPEQIRSAPVDARTDIYSAGATLFFMLTGRAPFKGDAIQVVADIVSETPPTVREIDSAIPVELSEIVAGTLEKDPNRRPQSAAELRQALMPFSSRNSGIGDVGRRMAAFFVDSLILAIATIGGLAFATAAFGLENPLLTNSLFMRYSAALFTVVVTVMFFAITEWRWGYTPGKRLMGLRVVATRGAPPKFATSLIRAAMIPGIGAVFRSLGPILFYQWAGIDFVSGASNVSEEALVANLAFPVLTGLIHLGVMSSVRRSNGFRGWHDILTSTRVTRIPEKSVQSRAIPVTVPIHVDVDAGDQYEIAGQLCETSEFAVYAATDKGLSRKVWLMRTDCTETTWSAERIGISRGTRQHILRSHTTPDGIRWDALEAISGSPFCSLEFGPDGLNWARARQALIDLTTELIDGTESGTLPSTLTPSQVWLDTSGRVKLLDIPLSVSRVDHPVNGAVPLLRSMFGICRQILPGRALDLSAELETLPDKLETLKWVRNQLEEISDTPGPLRWDERLGVVAISAGTEWQMLNASMLLITILCVVLIGSKFLLFAVATVIPAVLGYFFEGGPVFRVAQVKPRRNGKIAGRWLCAWRGFIAWLPATLGTAFMNLFVVQLIMPDRIGAGPDSFQIGMIYFGIAMLLLAFFIVGAGLAIAMPRRGLQDWLSGTELISE